ncbi:unnamed protein product [Durusdinium trenchii]|uniref:JmjC domain-containing protein n=1 Tax=Durusdinium trenchii TaxID=1381693 RepID=A0ABP0JHS5_9DINO
MALRLAIGIGHIARAVDPALYVEPEETIYWRPRPETGGPPFDAPRFRDLSRAEFTELIEDGKVFVVPEISKTWILKDWDCDFFQKDEEFKHAAMNHQYTSSGKEQKLGDDWQKDQTASGAKNATAPQVAPFYWGIKDVQFERRPGWTRKMLQRVAKSFQVPSFMDPTCQDDFASTPEFWFGSGSAGAKAHMDSHVQATLSVQIAGTKRWRLMPLRRRRAPFLAMIYSDGQPYENPEGWAPLFDITLQPGDGLFFPPGMVHETKNVGDLCTSSVTFQFNQPYAARFYRSFFPRIRFTADIGESWALIREWARLGMSGDEKGKGDSYEKARQKKDLEKHFGWLDKDQNGLLTLPELAKALHSPSSGLAWHDSNRDGAVSLEEFQDGFAFWSAVTAEAVRSTPKEWRKFQLFGTIENLEDIPGHLSKKMRQASFQAEMNKSPKESGEL